MPSIIPSPGSPGIAPNFDEVVNISSPYSVAAGTVLYSTTLELMFNRADYQEDGQPIPAGGAPFVNAGTLWNHKHFATVISSQNFDHVTNQGLIVAESPDGQATAIQILSRSG